MTLQHQLSDAADCLGCVSWCLLHNPPEVSGVQTGRFWWVIHQIKALKYSNWNLRPIANVLCIVMACLLLIMSELAGLFLKYFGCTSLLVKTTILWLKQARSWLSLTRWVWLELCLCLCSGWLEQELQYFGFWVRINTWWQQYCCFFKHYCLWQSVLKKDLRQKGEGNFAAFKSRCPSHLLFITKAEAIAEQLWF